MPYPLLFNRRVCLLLFLGRSRALPLLKGAQGKNIRPFVVCSWRRAAIYFFLFGQTTEKIEEERRKRYPRLLVCPFPSYIPSRGFQCQSCVCVKLDRLFPSRQENIFLDLARKRSPCFTFHVSTRQYQNDGKAFIFSLRRFLLPF